MRVNEKIRKLRESKEWSQEQMAEKMSMSLNGYAKIERGETKLHLDKLEQIAQVLDVDFVELITEGEKNVCFQIESPQGSVYQGSNDQSLMIEIEKLKLALKHKDELLEQKQLEINRLDRLIQLLEQK